MRAHKPARPVLSVVIPSYNEATYIDRLLEALLRQSFQDFEVIVSDAKSSDGTAEVVRRYQDRMRLTVVQNPPKGPAAGRNQGAAAAAGDWLLFLDADVDIDDPDFIETLLSAARQRGWQTATSAARINSPRRLDKLGLALHQRYLRLLSHTKHPVAPGFCILTRRDLFESLGGYDATLWVGEDYDYVTRAGSRGFGIAGGTYYYVDLRRFDEGGKVKVFLQSIGYEVYRFTHGYRIDRDPFQYEFGAHKRRQEP